MDPVVARSISAARSEQRRLLNMIVRRIAMTAHQEGGCDERCDRSGERRVFDAAFMRASHPQSRPGAGACDHAIRLRSDFNEQFSHLPEA